MMHTLGLQLGIGDRVLVTALNWEVHAEQSWCIIGRNGAGKSILLRTLAGLREPDGGSVQLRHRSLPDWPLHELARERAFLAQGRSDAFGYSVLDSVLSARHPYLDAGFWESDGDYQAAYAALRALDVHALAERDVRTLSGGERQRVAIAAVMAQDIPLLLLDEPANALDLAHQVSTTALLAALCRESNKAVVMVSHDLNLIHGTASHALLLMSDGQWQAGPLGEVLQAPILSRCLGHPIETVRHGSRTIYVPVENTHHE